VASVALSVWAYRRLGHVTRDGTGFGSATGPALR
jgi:hypothetical protein